MESYVDSWRNDIRRAVSEDGLLDEYYSEDDLDDAHDKLRNYIRRNADSLSVPIRDEELESIFDACDVESIIESNQNRIEHKYEGPNANSGGQNPMIDEIRAIHDLFERP